MMISKSYRLCGLATISLIICLNVSYVLSNNTSWYSLQKMINGLIKLHVQETLNALMQMKQLHDEKLDQYPTDEVERIEELIKVSQVDVKQCNKTHVKRLKELVDREKELSDSPNILPYLLHYKAKLGETCKIPIIKEVHKSVEKLIPDDRTNMENFNKKLIFAKTGKQKSGQFLYKLAPIKRKYIIQALVMIMDEKFDLEAIRNKDADKFRHNYGGEFFGYVEKFCYKVRNSVYWELFMAKEFSIENSLGDDFAAEWLANAEICYDIVDDVGTIPAKPRDYIEETMEFWIQENESKRSKRSKRKRVQNWLETRAKQSRLQNLLLNRKN